MNTRFTGIFLTLLSMCMLEGAQRASQLQRLDHHQAYSGDQAPYVELGNLIMYFDHEPHLQESAPVHNQRMDKITYFLSGAEVKSEKMKEAVNDLNRLSGELYTIRIKQISNPSRGLLVEITYDPSRVGILSRTHDSIGLQPSIVFTFQNKRLLEQIKSAGKPVLKTASRTRPIVIDCGHGGDDTGAIGCNKAKEKDISLQVGTLVAQLLEKEGVSVELTRKNDRTVELNERTTFANKLQASLLVSIHANHAANNPQASGIETYCLHQNLLVPRGCTLDQCLLKVHDDAVKSVCARSDKLAHCVHASLIKSVQPDVRDRHVRHAVAQVLLGSEMPAILVEIGFLSHPQEAALLVDANHQHKIASGITRGILSYLSEI